MKYRVLIILSLFSLIGATLAGAEEISFQASVNKKRICLDEQLIYILTIRGTQSGRPELGKIKGMNVLGPSVSTELSIINGRRHSSKILQYTLIPLKKGDFNIPPATLRYQGKTYRSHPIIVKVVDCAPADTSPDRSQRSPAPPAERLSAEASVDKTQAYINEQITLTFRLYSNRLPISITGYVPPPTEGFLAEDLGREKEYQQVKDGLLYDVVELQKAIFPISAGKLTIGSAELRGNLRVPSGRRRRGFFDDFFGDSMFYTNRPFVRHSRPLTVRVKPFPEEGRPENFQGCVGSFDLQVTASPRKVTVGEPITLTMRVVGSGNPDSVNLPQVNAGKNYKTYDPEVSIKRGVKEGRIGGEKIFKQVFIPLKAGPGQLPPAVFSYFDPAAEKYRTLKKGPFPIVVLPAAPGETSRLFEAAGSSGRREIEILTKDILYIKENPGRLKRSRPLRPWLGAGYLLPPILIIAIWQFRKRKEKLRSDLIYARRRKASRLIRRRFKKAREWMAAGRSDQFYQEVHRAFIRYLGDKIGILSGAVEEEKILPRLERVGASEKLRGEFSAVFAGVERARFAPGRAGEVEMKDFLRRMEALIQQLEKLKLT